MQVMTEEITDALMRASRALVAIAAASVADEQLITLPQYRALVVIAGRTPCNVSDLASALEIHPTTATRLVERLVSKELVKRSDDEQDRRSVVLALTRRGGATVRRVQGRRREAIARIVSAMGPVDAAATTAALESFSAAAGERGELDHFGWNESA